LIRQVLFFEIALAPCLGQKDGCFNETPPSSYRGGYVQSNGDKENAKMDKSISNGSGRLFYTVPEICKMLQVERKTVYRLIARGLLKTSNAIRHKRICSRSLDKFIETTVYGGTR